MLVLLSFASLRPWLHRETKHGGDTRSTDSQTLRLESKADRFTGNTAAATGQSERLVRLNAERGTKVVAEVIDMTTGTSSIPAHIHRLKPLSPNEIDTAKM
ncbi:hypothetical protein HFO28_07970 [Rhizobium leguminosarum]|uniref:hypothetical protein n=1 Tax=Rhizobium leguminosarum TaxID=384 RepID=UPI001C96F39E|nr:hypothetical protein [Rhizobium leguminosarum]MBY5743529.1 hypothetical protein [Rhizobium leguminosarum]